MAKAARVHWLPRSLMIGPYLCLVKNEAEWYRAFKDLGVAPEPFPESCGRCQTLENKTGDLCAIVLIQGVEERTPIEVAGLIVHEAVHVVQAYMQSIGESRPSDEFQAYVTQITAQRLMAQWAGEKHA